MLFKKINMGFSFLGISFFILEILMFFYYENQESDDVIRCATKIVKILNLRVSGNIKAVFLKLDT